MNRSEVDFRKCCECEYAKWTESFKDKNGTVYQIWKYWKHRQIITEYTLVSTICKGADYKRRRE